MKRRDFFKISTAGLTVGIGSLALPRITYGTEETEKGKIEPNELSQIAHRHFIEGKRTCSESILLAGCEALGIKSDLIPDIALGLAGGIGLQGDVCGVLTGSAMVLSLAFAAKETAYNKKKTRTLQAVGRVYNQFKQQFGHTDCRTLSSIDLTNPEDRKKLGAGVRATKCANFVKTGAEILAEELQKI